MNNLTKSLFISLYITLVMVASVHSLVGLWSDGLASGWLGAAVATWPMAFFFLRLLFADVVRTSANLIGFQVLAWGGIFLTLVLGRQGEFWGLQLLYSAGVGLLGTILYVYWYSRFQRQEREFLKAGAMLPAFELEDEAGRPVASDSFLGRPTLMIFYRGNWCPLCMAQVREVASQYQELADLGVTVALISPQPHENTRSLAEKFNVPLRFLVDVGNRAAKTLGIDAENGIPKGLEALGYDSDTVMPTVLITDATGKILFADLTDNYRVRPEPASFLELLRSHGFTA